MNSLCNVSLSGQLPHGLHSKMSGSALTTHFETPATLRAETEGLLFPCLPPSAGGPSSGLTALAGERPLRPRSPLPKHHPEFMAKSGSCPGIHPASQSCHENCDALFSPAPSTALTPRPLASLCSAVRAFFCYAKRTPSQRSSNGWKKCFQPLEKVISIFPMLGKPDGKSSKPWNIFFQGLEN